MELGELTNKHTETADDVFTATAKAIEADKHKDKNSVTEKVVDDTIKHNIRIMDIEVDNVIQISQHIKYLAVQPEGIHPVNLGAMLKEIEVKARKVHEILMTLDSVVDYNTEAKNGE